MTDRFRVVVGDGVTLMDTLRVDDVDATAVITDVPYNAAKNYGPATKTVVDWPVWVNWMDTFVAAARGCAPHIFTTLSQTAWQQYVRHGAFEPTWTMIWNKPLSLGVASQFMPHWEPIAYWTGEGHTKRKLGIDVLTHNVATGKKARVGHPTPKPLSLYLDLVGRVADPDALIVDPFAGSGTTGAAALILGCRTILCEIEPSHAETCKKICQAAVDGSTWEAAMVGQLPMFPGETK